MDRIGSSGERGSLSVSGHGSSGVRARRGRRLPSSPVRPGPVNVRAGGATVVPSAAAAETADQLQAEYFRRLLAQKRRNIEHRLAKFQKGIATAEAAGDTEGAGNLRRMARVEKQDRQTLDGMMANLQRRFPPRTRPTVR